MADLVDRDAVGLVKAANGFAGFHEIRIATGGIVSGGKNRAGRSASRCRDDLFGARTQRRDLAVTLEIRKNQEAELPEVVDLVGGEHLLHRHAAEIPPLYFLLRRSEPFTHFYRRHTYFVDEPESRHEANRPPGAIDLKPAQPVARRERERMMIVVPAFAPRN